MARNSEKANAMLNKWLRIKSGVSSDNYLARRPRHTSEVDTVKAAEHWRSLIIKDIMISISRIQNASLGEFAIRDLNDEINRLIGIRKKWDDRIVDLGGPDYRALSSSIENAHGMELKVGGAGYKYFGAARNLPGVRELFEKQENEPEVKEIYTSRAELYKKITPDYYGFLDEDNDPTLVLEELKREDELRRQKIEFQEDKRSTHLIS